MYEPSLETREGLPARLKFCNDGVGLRAEIYLCEKAGFRKAFCTPGRYYPLEATTRSRMRRGVASVEGNEGGGGRARARHIDAPFHTCHISTDLQLAPEIARARLKAALASSPDLLLAVLFGSRASGKARETSDFDVGILPRDAGLTLRQELELAAALSAVVGQEVDLVRLDGDDPLLGREIAWTGLCLFESEPGSFAAYRARATSVWLDFEETIAPHRAGFLRKLASK
ncbi:MAG: nucleotidyltransferase domain-containing protein [Deltaproteobacteria bacterium]